ncbi:MAG: cobaltochelatase subunit CobT [Halieaceae bacterium]|jgi:cobaltochelatase CobT|nr:cobaltochelatase subunit CobT [Halieaceae bacterium]
MESPEEGLKRVTAAAVAALSECPDLRLSFSQTEDSSFTPGSVSLPEPPTDMTDKDVADLRGAADALAMRMRYHDPALHRTFSPINHSAAKLFDAAEQARVEALGSLRLIGVAANLTTRLENYCQKFSNPSHPVPGAPVADLADVIALWIREKITGAPPPTSALRLMTAWRPKLDREMGGQVVHLAASLDNQEAFASVMTSLIANLDFPADLRAGEVSEGDEEQEAQLSSEKSTLAAVPQTDDAADRRQTVSGRAATVDQETLHYLDKKSSDDKAIPSSADMPAGPSAQTTYSSAQSPTVHYKTYTGAYDQVISAEKLTTSEDLTQLRDRLDRQLLQFQGVARRLANRLQRRLLARQTRYWDFDQEEGLLDAGRLARVVINPALPLSFKLEAEADFRDTVVSLLIDNSGSMHGRPIAVAAMSADILARTLERCGVKVEILGFTTQRWKGGHARQQWIADNKPDNPGRLNDLLHIIYKDADQPWRRVRRNLGLMLREGLLKENIDGEALLWAHARLLARPEQRRILLVISDGAPVDDATLSSNSSDYLEIHLRQVIHWIQTRSSVELSAIGIGHDVSQYYKQAVTIATAEDLGAVMMKEVENLFEGRQRAIRR